MHNAKISTGDGRHIYWFTHRANCAGFTLAEIMIALAITAVLANLAIPGFQTMAQNVRLTGEQNRFVKSLRTARSEAVKRARQVTICARSTNTECAEDVDTWEGWLVFEESVGGTRGEIETGESVLAVFERTGTEITISASARIRPADVATQSWVSFGPRGSANWTQGTFTLCDARGAEDALALVVNGAGSLRNVQSDSGAPANAQGTAVTCP